MVWGAIAGIASAGLSMWGASKKQDSANKQTQINYEAAKDNWKYENKSAERQIDFIREQNEVTRQNNIKNAKFQDATALNNWQMSIDQSMYNFGTQLLAKQKSDQTLGAQLGHNQQAMDVALKQQDQWMKEKGISKDFALKDQDLIMTRADNAMDQAYNEILQQRSIKADQIEFAYAETQVRRNQEVAMIAFQDQENIIDGLMKAGAAQNMQAGRSTDKAIQSAEAAAGRKTAQFEEQATGIFKLAAVNMEKLQTDMFWNNAEAERMRKKVGQDYMDKHAQYLLDVDKTWESFKSAQAEDYYNRQQFDLQKQQADLTAYADNMLMPIMGPLPKPPFATPLPEILDPEDHVWSPKPRKGAQQSGAVMGAVASALPGVVSGFRADAEAAK